jgi:predicted CXXCH cytochrome family protein
MPAFERREAEMSSMETRTLRGAVIAILCSVFLVSDGRASLECFDCHANKLSSSSHHFIETSADCMVCHRVVRERASHPQLDSIGARLCVDCHVRASSTLAAGAHGSLVCTACHDPHGSEYDHNHLADHDALCLASCHTLHELGESHPRGAGTHDAVTGDELTCVLACHSNHSYTHPMMLQRARRILCMRCHPDKY